MIPSHLPSGDLKRPRSKFTHVLSGWTYVRHTYISQKYLTLMLMSY